MAVRLKLAFMLLPLQARVIVLFALVLSVLCLIAAISFFKCTYSLKVVSVRRKRKLIYKKKRNFAEYSRCVEDLIGSSKVAEMSKFMQHGDISCLEHCLSVSYYSFLICKSLHLDFVSAARGGLLHDLFLYDWHETPPEMGLHAFSHPGTALKNASSSFTLNKREKDIIKKHMWPLTIVPPFCFEAFIVSCVDKYCAVIETANFSRKSRFYSNVVKAGFLQAANVA